MPSAVTIDENRITHIDGKPFFGPLDCRLEDLSEIPSPYTTGMMDKFFSEKFIPAIQTNRGCPFSCTYCSNHALRKIFMENMLDSEVLIML